MPMAPHACTRTEGVLDSAVATQVRYGMESRHQSANSLIAGLGGRRGFISREQDSTEDASAENKTSVGLIRDTPSTWERVSKQERQVLGSPLHTQIASPTHVPTPPTIVQEDRRGKEVDSTFSTDNSLLHPQPCFATSTPPTSATGRGRVPAYILRRTTFS